MKPQLKLIIGLQKEKKKTKHAREKGKKGRKQNEKFLEHFRMEKVLLSLFWQQYEDEECLRTILGYVSAGKVRILSAGISRERAMTFTLSKKSGKTWL